MAAKPEGRPRPRRKTRDEAGKLGWKTGDEAGKLRRKTRDEAGKLRRKTREGWKLDEDRG